MLSRPYSNEPCRHAPTLRAGTCRGIRRMCPEKHSPVREQAPGGPTLFCPRMAHCFAQEKEALPRHTAVCRENAPFSAIKESHIMYRLTLQRILPLSRSHILCIGSPCRESPSLQMYHITGFFNARLPGCRNSLCCFFLLYTILEKISIPMTDYLLTLAPAPPMMPSTSSTVAMEVSPGVVIASAP